MIRNAIHVGVIGLIVIFVASLNERSTFASPTTQTSSCNAKRCEFIIVNGSDDVGLDHLCDYSTGHGEIYLGECITVEEETRDIVSGLRFEDVTIDSETTIIHARLEFVQDGDYDNGLAVRVYGEKVPNSSVFTSTNTLANRTLTTSFREWPFSADAPWIWNSSGQSVNLSDIVQEIISENPGWASGNAMSFIIKDNSLNLGEHRRFYAYERPDTGGTLAAKLITMSDEQLYYSKSYYVPMDWGDTITYLGQPQLRAYRFGYEASVGTSDTIILHFGRKFDDVTDGWGVKVLFSGGTYKSNAWVEDVAQAFINGFSAGHPGRNTIIAVGVNSANAPWLCENGTGSVPADGSEDISPDWRDAGIAWGIAVSNLTSVSNVFVASANDFEAWDDIAPPWIACGAGAVAWLDGFSSSSNMFNINFGNDATTVVLGEWPSEQLYYVSWGGPNTLVLPQIYCDDDPIAWSNLLSQGNIVFGGATVDNGTATIWPGCNGHSAAQSYLWNEAWNALYDTLVIDAHTINIDDAITWPASWPNP